MTLKNKNIIITGGGRGIGAATAKLLAGFGGRVFIVSQTKAELETIANEIKLSGGEAVICAGNVADEKSVRSIFDIVATFGGADILVNNAAVGTMKPFLELTNEDWANTLEVNVMGIVFCCREAIRQMQGKKEGSIVNISSLGGLERLQKFVGFSAYSVSKFGVVGLTECLAEEVKSLGIRVNCLAPGAVDTQMLRMAAPQFKANTQPIDVARLIHFLCDQDLSGNMTGNVIPYFCN